MRKRVGQRHGQSILEYLIIAALVVGAILVVAGPSGPVAKNVGTIYNQAGNKTSASVNRINNMNFE